MSLFEPDIRSLIVRGPLARVSERLKNVNYIADMVFPIMDNVPVKAKYTKYRAEDWFRDEAGIRAPGTDAPRSGFNIDFVDINPKQFAHASVITQEEIQAQAQDGAPPTNLVQDAIEFSTDKIDLKKEKRVAALILADTDWNGAGTGGEDAAGLWTATSGNTFLVDIRTRIKTIQSKTGFTPNHLILDLETMLKLKEVADITDKIKFTQRSIVTPDLLASLLELQKVLVGRAVENTANEKDPALTATFTAKAIWEVNADKGSAFLFYRPPSLGLKTPTAGAQFRVKQSNGQGRITRFFREESPDLTVYETREETDIVAINSNLGFLWKDTHTT